MNGHRRTKRVLLEAIVVIAAAGATAGCACGRTTGDNASLSDPDGDRGSEGTSGAPAGGRSGASSVDGGSPGNEPPGGTGGSTSGGGAAFGGSGFGGAGGAGTAGSGTGGSAIGGSPPLATGGRPTCEIFESPPIPDPTSEDLERAALIHDFCVTLARDGCLGGLNGSGFIGDLAHGCSIEQKTTACEQDLLTQYLQWILPPCEEAWRTAITCAAAASYTGEDCNSAGLQDSAPTRLEPCEGEKQALEECVNANNPWQEVTGARTTCAYGPGTTSPCAISCQVDDNFFSLDCGGPPGVPMRCSCFVNGRGIGDQDFGPTSTIHAEDCRDAAQRAADGICTNRLDCCIAYFDGEANACICGSDPTQLGYSSCEAMAQAANGAVVEICPLYELDTGGCWPPPCAN